MAKISTEIKKTEEQKVVKKMEYEVPRTKGIASILITISSVGLAIISIALGINGANFFASTLGMIITISFIVCLALGLLGIFLNIRNYKEWNKQSDKYIYYVESKRISTALLESQKRIDFAKTCSILQSTYGHVHEWHPIDYCKNVLVYDVHQHLRSICIRLKEMIISLAPNEFNDDMVTVDIAYRYPSDEKFDPMKSQDTRCSILISSFQPQTDSSEWRIITSGDHTTSDNALQKYLKEGQKSFYNFLGTEKYYFGNDKQKLAQHNHYMWSQKDIEYGNIGSIVGKAIELKNDTPETVFVEVYLTITTYGRKLVEENDSLSEHDFETLFKETVINSYKTLIETELAQMFIRHGIRDHFINPESGAIIYKQNNSCSASSVSASPSTPGTTSTP